MARLKATETRPAFAAVFFARGFDRCEFGLHYIAAFAEGALQLRGFKDHAQVIFLWHGDILHGVKSAARIIS